MNPQFAWEIRLAVTVAALAVLLFLADRLLLWCEARGWIYYRRRKASPGTAASALLEAHSLLEPGKEHVVKEAKRVHEERDDEGEPPNPQVPG